MDRSVIKLVAMDRSVIKLVAMDRSVIKLVTMDRSVIKLVAMDRSVIKLVAMDRSVIKLDKCCVINIMTFTLYDVHFYSIRVLDLQIYNILLQIFCIPCQKNNKFVIPNNRLYFNKHSFHISILRSATCFGFI
jgi:hypothetical protein